MKPGDTVESAIWITGDEPKELRVRYEKDVTEAIDYFCHEHGFIYGPIQFLEKQPGADRVPPVPDHVQGSRVRLLVAESIIEAKLPESPKGSFIANLDKKDLSRLRKITRQTYANKYGRRLSDLECDDVIEEIGPEAALDTLRRFTDNRMVH